jgi:hypothetical protein
MSESPLRPTTSDPTLEPQSHARDDDAAIFVQLILRRTLERLLHAREGPMVDSVTNGTIEIRRGHQPDMLVDTEIGGVRKVKGGAGDVGRITSPISG